MVLISLPEHKLASRLSQYHKYLSHISKSMLASILPVSPLPLPRSLSSSQPSLSAPSSHPSATFEQDVSGASTSGLGDCTGKLRKGILCVLCDRGGQCHWSPKISVNLRMKRIFLHVYRRNIPYSHILYILHGAQSSISHSLGCGV